MKDKKQIAFFCFFTDVSLSIWTYFKLTNYDEYVKAVKPMIDSPDFQVQMYQVMLQSLTFSLLLFLVFHLVIYFLFLKEKMYAIKYLRFYTAMAVLSSVIMIFSKMFIGFLPLIIYGLSFVAINKMTKALAQTQTPPQSTKPQLKNK